MHGSQQSNKAYKETGKYGQFPETNPKKTDVYELPDKKF